MSDYDDENYNVFDDPIMQGYFEDQRIEKRNKMLMYVGLGILLVVSIIVLIYVLNPLMFNTENYSDIYEVEQDIRQRV